MKTLYKDLLAADYSKRRIIKRRFARFAPDDVTLDVCPLSNLCIEKGWITQQDMSALCLSSLGFQGESSIMMEVLGRIEKEYQMTPDEVGLVYQAWDSSNIESFPEFLKSYMQEVLGLS